MFRKTTIIASAGFIAALIALLTITFAYRPAGSPEDERLIREHIDKIFRAYISKDSQTVRATHSEEWRGFLSYSTTILRGIDDYMKEALGHGTFDKDNPWRLVNYRMLDYDIVFRQRIAIVNYIAELYWQQDTAKGSYILRSIDIYGKEKGRWSQLASHIGPLPSWDDNH